MNNHFTFYAHKPEKKYHKSDFLFFISVLLLTGFGLFTMFVCSQNYASFVKNDAFYFVKRQFVCTVVGFVFFMVFMILDMKTIRKLVFFLVIISIVLCILTFIKPISVEKNGARRWVLLPFKFTFQPSELVKFAVVLYLANYFEKQFEISDENERDVLPCVGVFLFFVILILAQKDFSTSMFVTVVGILMFYVSGSKLKWFWPFIIIAIPIVIIMIVSVQYRVERIIGFLNPSQGKNTINYQVEASKKAIMAGGIWGNGIGRGLSKLNSIPEVQSDFIFAGWTEAMGFIGVVGYFLLLCFFTWRGYKIAFNCPSRFAAYGSFGCITFIFLQSILNCMFVCGLLPSTGIPLPFYSVGGSSIMVTLGMCGFVLNASRFEEKEEDEIKYEDINVNTLTVL